MPKREAPAQSREEAASDRAESLSAGIPVKTPRTLAGLYPDAEYGNPPLS